MITAADPIPTTRCGSRVTILRRVASLLAIAGLGGCGIVTIEADPGAGCDDRGTHYAFGDSFPAPDGCNTLTCTRDHGIVSTLIACGATCSYGGHEYAPGQTFPSTDGCNACSCIRDGAVSCTSMVCGVCTYDGKLHAPGESFPALDGCNTCTCGNDGSVACTEKACAPVCTYAGATYAPGESFPALDGCNTCTCGSDGSVGCTKMACACSPKDEWYRAYVGTSPSQCAAIDFICPAHTSYFANGCGCGCEQASSCPRWFDCMPPASCDEAKIKAECPYSGITY